MLDWMLQRTASALQSWSMWFISSVRVQLAIANEIILQLVAARDRRPLAPHEEGLHKEMKLKSLGLSSLQRSIARQESRLLWLSDGDVLTKFFRMHPNVRGHRKVIRSLEHDSQVLVSEEGKAEAFLNFFDNLLGSPSSWTHGLNLDRLELPQLQLVDLENASPKRRYGG
jgi:hypothetical protein